MRIKERIGYLIARTLGTLSFIRIIEWREMLKLLKPQKGETILDVACGGGELSLRIARRNCRIYGIDISTDRIYEARFLHQGHAGKCFLIADAEHLPYEDCAFDKLICSSSLEHFNDDILALKEMHRVLRENGMMVLTVDSLSYPLPDNLKERHRQRSYVVNYYNSDELIEKLENAGFKMLSFKYLINSPVTSFFYNLYVLTEGHFYRHILLLLFCIILIPLMVASDKLIGNKNCGYTLIVQVEKK